MGADADADGNTAAIVVAAGAGVGEGVDVQATTNVAARPANATGRIIEMCPNYEVLVKPA